MSALQIGEYRRCIAAVRMWCLAVITAGVVSANADAADAAGDAYASLSAKFSEGDFGTAVNYELYSLIPEFGYINSEYDLSASLPLQRLRVSGGGLSSTDSGIGDAVLRAGRRLSGNVESGFSLTGALTIKLATGDENKGLGTGGTDVGASLSGSKKIGAYTYTALVGYTEVGEPSGVSYDNVVTYGIGANRSFSHTNVFIALQGQTSAVPDGTAPLEFDVGFFHILSQDYVVITHAFIGLSDGSPNDGITLGVVRWF